MISRFFNRLDKSRGPSMLATLTEGRAVVEPLALLPTAPLLHATPKGDGHPVLVLPGFSTGDMETVLVRQFLTTRNYRVHAWNLGRNVGPMAGLEKRAVEKARQLAEVYGTKVSLIGWSLGGLFARYVAHEAPEVVRTVITLGSPIQMSPGLVEVSPVISSAARLVTSRPISELFNERSIDNWRHTPPVPTSAIYSYTDGAVHWLASCDPLEREQAENIRVPGSHCGLVANPFVYTILANRLAQPEGQWEPFEHNGIFGVLHRISEPFKRVI